MEEYKALIEEKFSDAVKKLNQWRHEYDIEVLSHWIHNGAHYLLIKRTPKEN
jgi:hypothetical protein